MAEEGDALDLVLTALTSHHEVRRTKMFGKDCLKAHGKVLAVFGTETWFSSSQGLTTQRPWSLRALGCGIPEDEAMP